MVSSFKTRIFTGVKMMKIQITNALTRLARLNGAYIRLLLVLLTLILFVLGAGAPGTGGGFGLNGTTFFGF
jgi:hypothetical protein